MKLILVINNVQTYIWQFQIGITLIYHENRWECIYVDTLSKGPLGRFCVNLSNFSRYYYNKG